MRKYDIIPPLRPRTTGWQQLPPPPPWVTYGYAANAFFNPASGLSVISAVEVAHEADGIDRGPEYHLSISKRVGGKTARSTMQEAQAVLQDFGLDGAEEDNHVPHGFVRNFWRPVAENLVGMECDCKTNEPAMVEDKGDYIWRGLGR